MISEHFNNKNIDGILGLAPYTSQLTQTNDVDGITIINDFE